MIMMTASSDVRQSRPKDAMTKLLNAHHPYGWCYAAAIVSMTCLFGGASRACGDSIQVSTELCQNSMNADCLNTTGTTSTAASQTFNSGGGSLTVSASANASYGVLGTAASEMAVDYPDSFQIAPGEVLAAAAGVASFTDSWEVLGGSVNGGLLDLTFTGTGTSTSGSPAGACASFSVNGSAGTCYSQDFTQTVSIPFTLATATEVEVQFVSLVSLSSPNGPPYTGSAFLKFADTLTLSNVEITDMAGNPIHGASIIASSDNLPRIRAQWGSRAAISCLTSCNAARNDGLSRSWDNSPMTW